MKNLYSKAYLRWVNDFRHQNIDKYMKFVIEGVTLGWIHKNKIPSIKKYPNTFEILSDCVILASGLKTQRERTQAVDQVARDFHEHRIISGWRDEQYPVSTSFNSKPYLFIERSAASFFGILKYGVHVNGLAKHKNETYMWIAQRSQNKPKYPGYLDNIVAGGLTAHYSPLEMAIKECGEEAAISPDIAKKVIPVGTISYCVEHQENLIRDIIFIFDLELPISFKPSNKDGEVAEFFLWVIEDVMEKVALTKEFKPNCNLVIIDFLLRHGYIRPQDSHYVEISNGLRSLSV